MITYPLNNIDYTAEDAELYFSTRESGVYDGNDFEVTVSGIDNDVTVGTGIAWIHNTKFSGKVVALKEPKTLTLSLPNSVYDRIDAIVIQFDANQNATEIVVKDGIASSSPIAPTVFRTESLYELHIFHVQRKAGATVISIDDLVDLRNDSDYCGIMFDSISSIDSTLTKSGYAADAAETGKQIKRAITVLNMLDNSDFTNPVNQRGLASYTGGYTIDRWRASNALNVNNGSIKVSGYIRQRLMLADGIYTLAAKGTSGNVYIHVFKVSGTTVTTLSGPQTIYATYESGYVQVGLNTGDWAWAALYEGEYTNETLPPYVPKGYAAELMECQRYYQQYKSLGFTARNNCASTIVFPVQMRVIPTLNVGDFKLFIDSSNDVSTSHPEASLSAYKDRIEYVNNFHNGFTSAYAWDITLSADL